MSEVRPLRMVLALVIGVFENRHKTVPVTFSSESLDIRHRHPDRMGQGVIGNDRRSSFMEGFQSPGVARTTPQRN